MPRLAVLILSVLLLTGCAEAPAPALRVGVNPWVGYDPLVLAAADGLLARDRVRIVELSSSTESKRALRNGLLDGAAMTLDEVLRLADSGLALRIIAVLDDSRGGDAVLARPGINNPAGLRGQTIGLEQGALGALMLERLLATGQLTRAEVNLVQVEASQVGAMLANGRADAVITFEPIRSWLVAQGYKVIFDSRAMPGEVIDVLVARAGRLDDALPRWAELLVAWERARTAFASNPEALARLAPGTDLTPAAYQATLAGLALHGLDDNQTLLTGPAPRLASVGAPLAQTMLDLGLIQHAPDWSTLIDPRPLALARARLGAAR